MAADKDLYKESQKRLIGSLLFDSTTQNRVLELVTVDDFREPRYHLIFNALVLVARANTPVSPISIAKELDGLGELEKAGGTAELYQLYTNGSKWTLEAPTELYAKIVKEYSAKNYISDLLKENFKLLKPDSGATASEAISIFQNEFNSVLYKLSDVSTIYQFAGSMEAYEEMLAERRRIAEENEGEAVGLQGIPSLIPSLNKYTSGWLPGQLITVGARTGIGKSVLAVNSAVAAARAGKSVLFFSLEMGEAEIKDRMVACSTGISLNSLKQGRLTEEEHETFMQAREELDQLKIQIDTDPKVTIDTIRARAMRMAQSEMGLDMIILDYLQLVTPVGRFSSRQEAVADMSRNTKLLAKLLEVPIMVLVQVNRESNNDESDVPRIHQIRESGAIAQDSDIVILLHREESLDDEIPHTLVLLEKNRNGEANKTIRCHSNLECSLFREVQRARDLDDSAAQEAANELDKAYGEDDDLSFDDDDEMDLDFEGDDW